MLARMLEVGWYLLEGLVERKRLRAHLGLDLRGRRGTGVAALLGVEEILVVLGDRADFHVLLHGGVGAGLVAGLRGSECLCRGLLELSLRLLEGRIASARVGARAGEGMGEGGGRLVGRERGED